MNTVMGLLLLVGMAACGTGGEGSDGSTGDGTNVIVANGPTSTRDIIRVRIYDYDTGELFSYSPTVEPGDTFSRKFQYGHTYNVDVTMAGGVQPDSVSSNPPWVGPNVSGGTVMFWSD